MKRWLWIVISLLASVSVIAQEATCAEIQRNAFDAITEFCSTNVDYVMCYGNPTLSVAYNETADDTLRFALPGDLIPITAVDWFSTSSEANTWGTAHVKVRGYPSDALTPIWSTMIVFGDVLVQNRGTENISIFTNLTSISASQGANLRAEPSTDAPVVDTLMESTTVVVSGRLADDTWVRVHTSQDDIAWLSTQAIPTNFMTRFPIVDPDEVPDRLSMSLQAFDFQSGLPIANCDGAGLSGILLQTFTPFGGSPPVYEVNGVSIEIEGTVFLQAHPDTGLLVSVLDGGATVTALDESLEIDEGYVSRVFMELDDDDRLVPIEPAGTPLVYDYDALLSLPLDLLSDVALSLDIYTLVTPRPIGGESPIAGMALDAPCRFTVGETGANIRSAPDPNASIIAVMGYRESASPIGRSIGADGMPWWTLAEGVWIRIDTTVTGGDCTTVPNVELEG